MRAAVALLLLLSPVALGKKPVPPPQPELAVRWSHGAPEHAAVFATVYAAAADRALYVASRLPEGTPWVVVADLDETLIDNSQYQIDVTGVGFTPESWKAWEQKATATPLPGAVHLVSLIHAAGGQLAYISNRTEVEPTLKVLQQHGLWEDDDRLCLKGDGSNKAPRRESVRTGGGLCGWVGQTPVVVLYLGDQMGDFPAEGEEPSDGLTPWGHRWFMLPNPMYGDWAR
jgi:5'-nucleotidase (lipoprotein e(P4) family)